MITRQYINTQSNNLSFYTARNKLNSTQNVSCLFFTKFKHQIFRQVEYLINAYMPIQDVCISGSDSLRQTINAKFNGIPLIMVIDLTF